MSPPAVGAVYRRGGSVRVPALLGAPPVFVRAGAAWEAPLMALRD